MMKDAATAVLRQELEALKQKIIAQHIAAGQKASGRTIASIHVEVKESDQEDEGILFGRNAFGTLETGRKPGKVPYNFVSIIRQWMSDKGIAAPPIPYKTDRPHKYTPEERGAQSMAYLIARKIKKQGTSLFRSGGRADIYSNVIPDATERIKQKVVELLGKEVKSIKINKIEIQ